MFFEKDNIVFDKDENETGILDFDIYFCKKWAGF